MGGWFTNLCGQARSRLGRLNPDGTLDASFDPGANDLVYALAPQADGRILVGGIFSTLAGQPRSRIGRLNPDGTLDASFDPGANGPLICLVEQVDGKILAGGQFTLLGGRSCTNFGRLCPDGTPDPVFESGANDMVCSLALQTDGRILAGGEFTTFLGQNRACLARLNPDGTIDLTFNPGAQGQSFAYVHSLVVQADGKILVGGQFTTLGGQNCTNLGRLNITEPATQSLTFDASTITWLRGGTSPEVWRTAFDYSSNGLDWTELGAGTRLTDGWELSGLWLPAQAIVRARGFVVGGHYNSSGWFVESWAGEPPLRLTALGFGTPDFRFAFLGVPGVRYVAEYCDRLDAGDWTELEQRTGSGRMETVVDSSAVSAMRFYRVRLAPGP